MCDNTLWHVGQVVTLTRLLIFFLFCSHPNTSGQKKYSLKKNECFDSERQRVPLNGKQKKVVRNNVVLLNKKRVK